MTEKPINWRLAGQILWRHNQLANKITTAIVLSAWLVSWLIARALDVDYYPWLSAHKIPIVIGFVLLHFIPVNLVAVHRIFKQPFKKFRLAIVPIVEEEADS